MSRKIMNGDVQIVFAHPEAILSKEGCNLMNSKVFERNVVACVFDEAHCIEIWPVLSILATVLRYYIDFSFDP